MADFIPNPDNDFNEFAIQLATEVASAISSYGVSAGQATDLAAAKTAWTTAYADFLDKQAAFHASTLTKDDGRATFEEIIRSCNATVQAQDPAVSDALKELAGFPVRETSRTRAPIATSGVMIISAVAQAALQQVVHFRNQDTPDVRAKPRGQKYAEIRAQVGGTAPLNGDAMESLGLDGATPYLAQFDAGDENKVVYYCARWMNTRGEPGPWGPVFTSSVPGAGGGA